MAITRQLKCHPWVEEIHWIRHRVHSFKENHHIFRFEQNWDMDCDGVWFSFWFTYRYNLISYESPCALIKCNKIKTIWDEADENNNNNDDNDVKRRQIKSTNREILGIVFNNNTDVYHADTRRHLCSYIAQPCARNCITCMHAYQ